LQRLSSTDGLNYFQSRKILDRQMKNLKEINQKFVLGKKTTKTYEEDKVTVVPDNLDLEITI